MVHTEHCEFESGFGYLVTIKPVVNGYFVITGKDKAYKLKGGAFLFYAHGPLGYGKS